MFNIFIHQITFFHRPIILFINHVYMFLSPSVVWASHSLGGLQFDSHRRKCKLETLLFWIGASIPKFHRALFWLPWNLVLNLFWYSICPFVDNVFVVRFLWVCHVVIIRSDTCLATSRFGILWSYITFSGGFLRYHVSKPILIVPCVSRYPGKYYCPVALFKYYCFFLSSSIR